MRVKIFIALLLMTFGLILTPAVSYACGKNHKKTEKSAVEKQSPSQKEKNNHCDQPCKSKHAKNQGCGSTCNHSNCKCVHSTTTIFLTQETLLEGSYINFAAEKKYPMNIGKNLSEGFHNIWQPPKIS